ncbi:hypothetical protein EON65_21765 [archaeon]|nr:MAG: hypothetical protein EON65_21765 [archaeon]
MCDEDLAFNSVLTGQTVRYIKGGFEKAFRAVIASNPRCLLVFTTWNVQNRRSTIQTYDLGDKEEYAEDGEYGYVYGYEYMCGYEYDMDTV